MVTAILIAVVPCTFYKISPMRNKSIQVNSGDRQLDFEFLVKSHCKFQPSNYLLSAKQINSSSHITTYPLTNLIIVLTIIPCCRFSDRPTALFYTCCETL